MFLKKLLMMLLMFWCKDNFKSIVMPESMVCLTMLMFKNENEKNSPIRHLVASLFAMSQLS